jgi:hypothetical protein
MGWYEIVLVVDYARADTCSMVLPSATSFLVAANTDETLSNLSEEIMGAEETTTY